jgi:hypothetical protein
MTMTLRHIHPDKGAPAPSVEELQALIGRLTAERQTLRATKADTEVLERNRREIAATQWQLSYALIERYLPQAA